MLREFIVNLIKFEDIVKMNRKVILGGKIGFP